MVEARERERFAAEALARLAVLTRRGRQHLDRDLAVQPRVAGAIDLAHSPRTERGDDLVGAEAGAGEEPHPRNLPTVPAGAQSHGRPACRCAASWTCCTSSIKPS